jgi:hypothetical protein
MTACALSALSTVSIGIGAEIGPDDRIVPVPNRTPASRRSAPEPPPPRA